MNHTPGKRVGQFISTQLLRDDYFIIGDTDASCDDINYQQKSNCKPFKLKLHYLECLCLEKKLLTHADFLIRRNQLINQFNQTQVIPTAEELLELFLPQTVIRLNKKDFGRQQAYARLLKEVAAATNECYLFSGDDACNEGQPKQWKTVHKRQYKTQTYRFTQQGHDLNDAFFTWLIDSIEHQANHRVSCHGPDEQTILLCLPPTIHSLLIDKDAALFAA